MFDNIGGKIKTLAQVVCWIGIIASVVIGFILMVQDDDTALAGILIMVLGSLASWIGSFMTYGFGQLIENSDILVKQSNKLPEKQNNTNYTTITSSINEETKHLWRCDGCGNMISENVCPICHKASEGITEKLETLNKWKEEYDNKREDILNSL